MVDYYMDGDSMTFEQLYHFLEVYHYGSITKAAQNLSVSRQAVAGSIKKLESEFGVELFERSAGGAVPTSPGEEFYTHASIIVREAAALRQNLLAFTTQCSPCSVCKIGLAESLLYNIGEELLEILSTTFPDVYFDISAFTYDPTTPHQYQLYDFSAPILFDSQYNEMMDVDDKDYIVSELAHFPASVWISADSPLAQYESLTFAQLGDMPYCMLKNSYNMSNMLHRLTEYFTEKPAQGTEVYLKNNFIDSIERFGYYTVDFPIINNRFFYEDLMQGHRVVRKQTDVYLSKKIIYNKRTCHNFYPIITQVLL